MVCGKVVCGQDFKASLIFVNSGDVAVVAVVAVVGSNPLQNTKIWPNVNLSEGWE